MKKINIYLKDLGFSDIESTIYLNLLKNGPSTVLEISRRTGVNRITTHSNAEALIKKGLLSTIKKGGKRYLIAEPAEKVNAIVNAEEISLNRKKALMPEIMELLKSETSHKGSQTQLDVRTYEGKVAIEILYDEILRSKQLRAFVNAEEINRIYPNNFKKFIDATYSGNIEIWDVVERNPFGLYNVNNNSAPNYHIKALPDGVEIGTMDYLIHDGKITIIDGDVDPVAVVISSPTLYLNSKAIFDCMWRLLS